MLRSLLIVLASASPLLAADWPQLHGPTRDGHSPEAGLNWKWPEKGPPRAWKIDVGAGLAGVSVANRTVYLFHRVDGSDVLQALSSDNGKSLWKLTWPTTFVDDYQVGDGPRCTPLVANGIVFAYGADGRLTAADAATGKELWTRNLSKDYSPPKGFFGVGAGPALVDGKLMVNVGAKGAGVVAFDPKTGKELWKAADDAASYSSMTEIELNGKPHAVAFTRAGLLVLDAKSGEVKFRKPWRSRLEASVNAAAPLVRKNEVFLTSSYGTGAILLKLQGAEPEEIWSNDKSLSCQFNTPVLVGEHLYGIDGRQEGKSASLRCVEWATGKVLWTQERFGCAHLIAVDGGLLAVNEDGEMIRIEASPKGYSEKARGPALNGTVRAAVALSDGKLYLRNGSELACITLK